MSDKRKTEIIAFCSGKGGTGKSLMCSCFGYALLHGGQRVLMIDGDPATDGLSLFLLGPKGQDQIPSFTDQNTFIGSLERFQKTGSASFEPRAIHRRGDDHGVTYHAIISGKGLYGEGILNMPAVPDLNQGVFRAGIKNMFDQLRESGEYDYVLVDTRGGFAFESTDLCALADSFIVITEPDYTSFYQDRNLVSRVAAAARDVGSPSLLRAMIVNKAVDVFPKPNTPYLDTLEVLFRDQLVKEFPVRFQDTHAVPVSIEALLAYKAQKIPYKSSPESMFCLATLAAYTDILGIVTSRWTVEQVDQWNSLVDTVSQAVQRKQALEEEKEQARLAHEQEFDRLRAAAVEGEARVAAMERETAGRLETLKHQYEVKVVSLERELEQRNLQYEREFARSEALTTTTIALAGNTTAKYGLPTPQTAAYGGDGYADQQETVLAAREAFILREEAASKAAFHEEEGARRETSRVTRVMSRAATPEAQGAALRANWWIVGVALVAVVAATIALGYALLHRRSSAKDVVPTMSSGIPNPAAAKVEPGTVGAAQASAKNSGTAKEASLPLPAPVSVPSSKDRMILNNYAVLLASGKLLTATALSAAPSAAYEAQLAMQAGYTVSLYQKAGRYTAAVLWDSQAQAEEAKKLIDAPYDGRWAKTSSIVNMSDWCPVKAALQPIVINNAELPVWSCYTVPSRGASAKY